MAAASSAKRNAESLIGSDNSENPARKYAGTKIPIMGDESTNAGAGGSTCSGGPLGKTGCSPAQDDAKATSFNH